MVPLSREDAEAVREMKQFEEGEPVKKKLKFKFEGVWGDGFIPFAVLWGGEGVGVCIFSFVFGFMWE